MSVPALHSLPCTSCPEAVLPSISCPFLGGERGERPAWSCWGSRELMQEHGVSFSLHVAPSPPAASSFPYPQSMPLLRRGEANVPLHTSQPLDKAFGISMPSPTLLQGI